jgi:hypothetical protein
VVELHSRAVFVRTSLVASACVWLCGIAHAAPQGQFPPGFVDLADVANEPFPKAAFDFEIRRAR